MIFHRIITNHYQPSKVVQYLLIKVKSYLLILKAILYNNNSSFSLSITFICKYINFIRWVDEFQCLRDKGDTYHCFVASQ